jgi:hypothetical protein
MNTKRQLCSWVVGMGFALGMCGAQAASIGLSPATAQAPQGNQITFDLIENFGTQLPLGGGTDFTWDSSVLTFQGFAFSSTFAALRDPTFDTKPTASPNPWDLQASNLVTIGFGNFNGISIPTDTLVGTLTFNVVGVPGSSTQIALSDSAKWSGFFDTQSNPITVSYTGATASVAPVSAVPLPASGWLLMSGFTGLLGIVRRRSAHAA